MDKFWWIVYNYLVLPILFIFIKLASFFNQKIKQGLTDRKRIFEDLILNFADIDRRKKLIWFHSASLGEFEQAKPIIEKIKKFDVNILITFFSPSGYCNSINYPYKDVISYLPLDSWSQMSRFILITRPDAVVLMRYDIWPNMIWLLNEKNIPTFIVDATMRENTKRKFLFSKNFHKSVYNCFTKILTVSVQDANNFSEFITDKQKVKSVGDTRFDRVYQKSLEAKSRKLFKENFFKNKKVFVAGSSWESDEDVFLPAFLKLLKYDPACVLILVPHEPTLLHLEKIDNYLFGKEKSIRFSSLNNYDEERIIIIDSIGILLSLYYYADVTYVGGSFKQGIHNVLEPAVYGVPVIYGPKIQNSQEAIRLSNNNGGMVIHNSREIYKLLRKLFEDETYRNELGAKSKDFVLNNIGATEKIIKEITSA